jgi:hypothetical protein
MHLIATTIRTIPDSNNSALLSWLVVVDGGGVVINFNQSLGQAERKGRQK